MVEQSQSRSYTEIVYPLMGGKLARMYDSETGNCYAFFRYYSPRLGRPDASTDTGRSGLSESDPFMAADPLGGDVASRHSLHPHGYVLNNALKGPFRH
jgi:uncharacterized protein RhaS with RHS repeats